MPEANRTLRRSVERKCRHVRVIVALLYTATLLFTIPGRDDFGILFMPRWRWGRFFGRWYHRAAKARVIYEYRLDGGRPSCAPAACARGRKEIVFTLSWTTSSRSPPGHQPMRDAEALTLHAANAKARLLRRIRAGPRSRRARSSTPRGAARTAGASFEVCFLPYPDFLGAIRALCPGKVMMTDGEIKRDAGMIRSASSQCQYPPPPIP